MKYWEIIAENLKKTGWSLGYVSAIDSQGEQPGLLDAHRDGKRFIARADEKLTAFVELERAIHEFAVEFDLMMAAQKADCVYGTRIGDSQK
jgi:hypothetical protein